MSSRACNALAIGARIAGLASLALGACASAPAYRCTQAEHAVVNEMLYFGTATPDGVVTAEQWAEFVNAVVTPLFPQGLTAWSAAGQWRSADGPITRETSHVLSLVHLDDQSSDAAIRQIMSRYRAAFSQEAVFRVRSMACASF